MAKTKKDKKTEDKAVKDEVLGEAGKATNTKEKKDSPIKKRRKKLKIVLNPTLIQRSKKNNLHRRKKKSKVVLKMNLPLIPTANQRRKL